MRIDIISAVPELLYSPLSASIIKRAQDKGIVRIFVHDLREYAYDKHRMIDDKPFSGGPGMLLKPEPFFECIEKLQSQRNYDHTIFTSPKGKIFDQKSANRLSVSENILFIAGHYKGIDDRVRERFATDEISIGNYVLSGGELPALVIIDSVVRLIPGVLGDGQSALGDSFQDEELLEPPYYTRPAVFRDMRVPEVLLSGNHQMIEEWKRQQSRILTEKWKKNNKMEQTNG